MPAFGNKTKRGILYGAALVIAVVLLFPFLAEYALNTARVRQKVAHLAKARAGIEIQPENIEFMVVPGHKGLVLDVGFKHLQCAFDPSFKIRVKALYVELDSLKLLWGKVSPVGISIDTPDISFTPAKPPGPSSPKPSRTLDLNPNRENVEKFFNLFPDSPDTFDLALSNLKSDYFKSLSGMMTVSKTRRAIELHITVQNVHLSRPKISQIPHLKTFPIQAIESETVELFAALSKEKGIQGHFTLGGVGLIPDSDSGKPVAANSVHAEFGFSRQAWSVKLSPADVVYPRAGQAGMEFYTDKDTGQTRLTFSGSRVDIDQARQASLALGSHIRVVDRIFDILREGIAKDVKVSFNSDALEELTHLGHLVITGSAQDASVKIPQTPLLVTAINGSVVIRDKILNVDARAGRVGGSSITKGKLELDLESSHHPFTGEFDIQADLSDLPAKLISLMPDTGLARELEKVHNTSGSAGARLFLEMKMEDPQPIVKVFAKDVAVKGSYERLPLPIKISKAEFAYTGESVILDNLSGSLHDSLFEKISAVIDLSGSDYALTIASGNASIRLEDAAMVVESIPARIEPVIPATVVSGRVNVNLSHLTGPFFHPGQWRFQLDGSGSGIKLKTPSSPKAVQNLSGRFNLTDKVVQISDLTAGIHDLSCLPGKLPGFILKSIDLPLKLSRMHIDMEKGTHQVSGQVLFPAGALLGFDLKGDDPDHLLPTRLSLTDQNQTRAVLKFNRDPDAALIDFQGRLHSKTIENLFIKGSPLYTGFMHFTGNSPLTIYKDETSGFHADISHINIDSLLDNLHQTNLGPHQKLWAKNDAHVNVKTLSFKGFPVSDLDATLKLNRDSTDIRVNHLNLCHLDASGRIVLTGDLTSQTASLDAGIRAVDKKNIEPTLACLFNKTHLIQGPFSFSCDLNAKAGLDQLSKNLNGALSFHSANGRIFKLTLLSRILSVLNVLTVPDLSQDGFSYHTFDVEGDIKDGVIHLNRAVIDGENMAIIFSGWISPFENDMDLTFLVAPFKTIDAIIQHIPVLSTALQGRLISFPAKAKGPVDDPVVTPLHPSAVGKGLVNIMTDIIKTPIRLFQETP